jgi:TIR domain
MAEHEFRAFFSYAHHDADTDPALIDDFTKELEGRVTSNLVNARFAIWHDEDRLRTGDRWNRTIEDELRRADVMIVLLTPRWINSDYCRKEYALFEEAETSRGAGEFVAPILARPLEQQERHLTREQRDILDKIKQRQYFPAKVTDFLRMSKARRNTEIEKIADDIVRMIDRLRDHSQPNTPDRDMVQGGTHTGGISARLA